MKFTGFFFFVCLRGAVGALPVPNEFLLRLCLRPIITCLFFKDSLRAVYHGVPERILLLQRLGQMDGVIERKI